MSDKNNDKQKKGVVAQIADELRKAKMTALKQDVKKDVEAYLKAEQTIVEANKTKESILETIAKKVEAAGQPTEALTEILSGV